MRYTFKPLSDMADSFTLFTYFIIILDIIHRPVIYVKYEVRRQKLAVSIGPNRGGSTEKVPPEDPDRIQSPKRPELSQTYLPVEVMKIIFNNIIIIIFNYVFA
jgi:hypothetical protein